MRILGTTLLLLLAINLHSQTVECYNNFISVYDGDTLRVYWIDSATVVTNAESISGVAPLLYDTTGVMEGMEKTNFELVNLPNTGNVIQGEIYNYQGEVCRIVQNHERSSVSHFDPHDVPALYLFREFGCPDWVQPTGGHDAYNIGDCVTFEGLEYESTINANVWSPTVYPGGWKLK